MKKQPQPTLYKVEEQKKNQKSNAVIYNDWVVKMILLPQSSVFPSHITFAIASGSKEGHGWEIVKIFSL